MIPRSEEALQFALAQSCLDAVAVGMVNEEEVRYNCALFAGEAVSPQWQSNCGVKIAASYTRVVCWLRQVVEYCPQQALRLETDEQWWTMVLVCCAATRACCLIFVSKSISYEVKDAYPGT